jgi:hypothetical protein
MLLLLLLLLLLETVGVAETDQVVDCCCQQLLLPHTSHCAAPQQVGSLTWRHICQQLSPSSSKDLKGFCFLEPCSG